MHEDFNMARSAWEALAGVRARRRRLKDFTFGRQWDDPVPDSEGRLVAEGEYYRRTGRQPITNNLMRSLVKSVVGRFRQMAAESPLPGGESLPAANALDELDARALEEFLISGCVIQKMSWEHRWEGQGTWVDNVNPARFFCNAYQDPRAMDMRLAGMLHDMTLAEMRLRFGHRSRRRLRDIDQAWARNTRSGGAGSTGSVLGASLSRPGEAPGVEWGSTGQPGLCRVAEVWTFGDMGRGRMGWRGRFYTPDGTLVDETPSPYAHRSHPFAVKMYPLTDGEVHPFMEDVVDQQRHINKLITTIDHILAHSAKGVLLFPQDALAPGQSFEDVIRIWSAPGAVVPVNSRASSQPRELYSAGRSEGASQLLELEMKMFQQISGVTSALQGHVPTGNVSAQMYDAQIQNATVALLDIYETFNAFRRCRNDKAARTVPAGGK